MFDRVLTVPVKHAQAIPFLTKRNNLVKKN